MIGLLNWAYDESIQLMSDYKFSIIWGGVGIVIGVVAFIFNYHMVLVSMPGYEVLVAPAMFTMSFFNEETYFTPKMILFLSGQFLGYFCFAYIFLKIKNVR